MKYCDISHTPLSVELVPLPCIFVWRHRRKKQGSNDEWTVILVVRELENLLPVTMDGKNGLMCTLVSLSTQHVFCLLLVGASG